MKKWLLVTFAAMLLFGLSACSGENSTGTSSTPGTPTIAKVRIWVTLSNNPDDAPVTMLTSAQTVQASIWARGTTEKTITFKVNLNYDDKFTTLVTDVRTEGSGKAVSVGALATPLEPGTYTFQAISGAFGEIVGSSPQITVTPDTNVNTLTETTPAVTFSEQPDRTTFQKYFSEMGFGRMAPDAKGPQDIQRNMTTFTAGDQLTLYGTVIQEVQVSAKYYDVATKQSVDASASPMLLKVGGFASSSNRTLPVGKYECKVYAANVLVAVFPFEVLATLTTTETSTIKHYTGDTISFDYPGNWVTTSPSSQYAIVTFIDPQAQTISVTVEKRAIPSGYTLKIFNDELAMGMNPTQIISGSFPTVAGVSACDSVFKINDTQFRMVNLEKDGNMYTILCNAPAATFDNAQISFNMVINSFQFQ
jgi:hypothetical protein